MQTLRYAEVSALHLEAETFAQLRTLADTQPGRPGGFGYEADNPWHQLVIEPHCYGCWVHTGVVEDGPLDELPASLVAVLREAHAHDAVWVLFDGDVAPLLDLLTFDHPDPPVEPMPRRVVFGYQVPVHVEVEDGVVARDDHRRDAGPRSRPDRRRRRLPRGRVGRLGRWPELAVLVVRLLTRPLPAPSIHSDEPGNSPGFVVSGHLA